MTDVAEHVLLDEMLDEVTPCQAKTKEGGDCSNDGTNHVKVQCIYCEKTMWRFFCDPCLDMIKALKMFHKLCMYNGGILFLIS